jgi:hypothetical protein
MTAQKFFGSNNFIQCGTTLGLAGGKEHIGRRDKQDMIVYWITLRRQGTFEESSEKGV